MKLLKTIWWRYMPGVKVIVSWPFGRITVDDSHPSWDWTMSAKYQTYESADPSDWYRPWLEENVGKQGWDWDWDILGDNMTADRLTIKLRNKHAHYASFIGLKWT